MIRILRTRKAVNYGVAGDGLPEGEILVEISEGKGGVMVRQARSIARGRKHDTVFFVPQVCVEDVAIVRRPKEIERYLV